jgi:hypothetical protein
MGPRREVGGPGPGLGRMDGHVDADGVEVPRSGACGLDQVGDGGAEHAHHRAPGRQHDTHPARAAAVDAEDHVG